MKQKIWFIIPWHRRPINSLWLSPSYAALIPYTPLEKIEVINLNFCKKEKFLKKYNIEKPDYLAFSCYIDNIEETKALISRCKEIYTNVNVIIGGPHITLLQKKALKLLKKVDNIIYGDGEEQLYYLLSGKNSIKNHSRLIKPYFSKFSNIYHKDLNSLKTPDYKYQINNTHFQVINIETSRGCPFNCPFCAYPVLGGIKLRKKRISKVKKEIITYQKKYNINHFRFVDASLTNPPGRFIKLLEMISNLGQKIYWCCFSHLDQLTKENMILAKKAGCLAMFVGVESGCDKTLKIIGKKYNEKKIIEISKKAKEIGIHMHANFIIGFPNEDKESIKKTINIIKKSDFPSITVNLLYLIPSSDFHINNKKWGIKIFDTNWNLNLHKYFNDSSLKYFNRSSLPQNELLKLQSDIKDYVDNSDSKYWDLKDYSIVAWHSIGGSISFLKKIWKKPEDFLTTDEVKYFNSFRDRTLTKLFFNDRLILLSKLKSIANKYY